MSRLFEDKIFSKEDFTQTPLHAGDYENCRFEGCTFANSDLSGIYFSDCVFDGCNMAVVKLKGTTFSNARFKNCKLTGNHFDDCNAVLFTVDFDSCWLDLSSFYKRKAKNTRFRDCNLREVDFTGADLTACIFDNCDFSLAIFDNTVLEKADLRSSYNYTINPLSNKIRKAKFSLQNITGLLSSFGIEIH